MPLSKTEQLANDLTVVLADSGLPVDQQIKAIGVARNRITRLNGVQAGDLDTWRKERLATGVVGSSKKSEQMRSELEALKKKPTRHK